MGSLLTAEDVALVNVKIIIKLCQSFDFFRGVTQDQSYCQAQYYTARLSGLEKACISLHCQQMLSILWSFLKIIMLPLRAQKKIDEHRMANLPQDCLIPDRPLFASVGIDYFCPFEVKCGWSSQVVWCIVHVSCCYSGSHKSCQFTWDRFLRKLI